eukprot:267722-Rhodomonas_salina.2
MVGSSVGPAHDDHIVEVPCRHRQRFRQPHHLSRAALSLSPLLSRLRSEVARPGSAGSREERAGRT